MKLGIVGAGMLGLTLGHRLGRAGHDVTLFDGAGRPGGLACSHDYGPFTWDRFYHCVLPQDARLLALIDELGLASEVRWRKTGTGYYAGGTFHPMNGNRDFLRFPLLSLPAKVRLGLATKWAQHAARPERLYGITAERWLTRLCGRRTYEVFWQPLLRAKFGPYADRVAAVFIWATLTRLMAARRGAAQAEHLGYVRGGYETILGALVRSIEASGGRVMLGAPVRRIERAGTGCRVVVSPGPRTDAVAETFDQVLFTAPSRVAAGLVDGELAGHVARMERDYPTSREYLGVACLVLALRKPLTPYYVLNIGDPRVEMTGLIEMTNLVDAQAETAGHALVYLPQYLASDDPKLDAPDGELREALIDRGLARLFPGFDASDIVYEGVHRARHVQPLPLARGSRDAPGPLLPAPAMERPFQVVNTSMLRCATLNNDEVVGLVAEFLRRNPEIAAVSGGAGPAGAGRVPVSAALEGGSSAV